MSSSSPAQLIALDRALLALCQERARLTHDLPGCSAAIEDLLRRSTGPLPAEVLRQVFELLDAATTPPGGAA